MVVGALTVRGTAPPEAPPQALSTPPLTASAAAANHRRRLIVPVGALMSLPPAGAIGSLNVRCTKGMTKRIGTAGQWPAARRVVGGVLQLQDAHGPGKVGLGRLAGPQRVQRVADDGAPARGMVQVRNKLDAGGGVHL